MNKHTDLQDKLLAALNFDMTGANMKTTDSYLRVKMTPDGRPSYLNDLIANLLLFTDQAEIRAAQGVNAPSTTGWPRWPRSPPAAIILCSLPPQSPPCSSTTGRTISTTAARTGSFTWIQPN